MTTAQQKKIIAEINTRVIPKLRELLGELATYDGADLLLLDINELVGQRVRLKTVLSRLVTMQPSLLTKLTVLIGGLWARFQNRKYPVKQHSAKLIQEVETKGIDVAFIATMESHFKSLLPLMDMLHQQGKYTALILPYSSRKWKVESLIPEKTTVVYIRDYIIEEDVNEIASQRKVYRTWFEQNKKQLQELFVFNGINYWPLVSSGMFTYITEVIPNHTAHIRGAARIIETFGIEYLVGARIRKASDIAFFVAAKQRGVKTTTVLHGIITENLSHYYTDGRYDLQDVVCVWNERQKGIVELKQLKPLDNIVITGNPQWDRMSGGHASRRQGLQQLGIEKEYKKIVTFCDQPSSSDDFRKMVVEQAAKSPETLLLVKVHPVLSKKSVAAVLPKPLPENIRILDDTDIMLYDSLTMADLMITVCSTVFVESLLLKTPIVFLQPGDNHLVRNWHAMGAPYVEGETALAELFAEDKTKVQYTEDVAPFVNAYLSTGQYTLGEITKTILQLSYYQYESK